MNKTITLLAITSLSFASKSEEAHNSKPKGSHFLTVLDDELHTLFTVKPFRPPYYPPPFFPEDDILYNDEELFSLEKVENGVERALNFAKEHPEIVKKAEEVINRYAENTDLLKRDAKRAFRYVAEHPEIVKQVANMAKSLNHDDELVNLDQLIKDGVALRKDIRTQDPVKIAQSKAKLMKDFQEAAKDVKTFLGKEDETDNNMSLWSHVKKEFEILEHAVEGV